MSILGYSTRSLTVAQRFDEFLQNLRLTEDQKNDGMTKHGGVRSCLNDAYWGSTSSSANSMLVGSWGKRTEVRPPRDIDILFVLPSEVYERFQKRPGNKQSQLLQEVKQVLVDRYSSTAMRGDGQVVVVKFSSYAVEVVPAFKLTSGQYWICNTNNGGTYKTIDPVAELVGVQSSDNTCNGNTRSLIRMMKCWQWYCSVPLKSFWVELLAIDFLRGWEYRDKSTVYYDWMVRDFLTWLAKRPRTYVSVAGTYESIYVGDDWLSRAESARDRAIKACKYEVAQEPAIAGTEWQKIFGTQIPIS